MKPIKIAEYKAKRETVSTRCTELAIYMNWVFVYSWIQRPVFNISQVEVEQWARGICFELWSVSIRTVNDRVCWRPLRLRVRSEIWWGTIAISELSVLKRRTKETGEWARKMRSAMKRSGRRSNVASGMLYIQCVRRPPATSLCVANRGFCHSSVRTDAPLNTGMFRFVSLRFVSCIPSRISN